MKSKYDIEGGYPCKANWVILKKDDDKIFAHNCLTDEDNVLSTRKARYLQSLDGRTDPFDIEGFSYKECEEYYWEMESELLIRKGRLLDLGDAKMFTIFIPKQIRSKSLIPRLYNILIMVLCIPVFLYAVSAIINNNIWYISDDYYILGIVVGLVTGGVMHEISHAMACLAYGGRFIEGGLMWRNLLPGAYCMIDDTTVSKRNNRLKRVQINLAGVEMNLLLVGLFILLILIAQDVAVLRKWTGMFYMASFQNLILVLLNLSFAKGLDGEHIISNLLGEGSIVSQALANIEFMFDRKSKHRYFNTLGINGVATICTSCVILLFQATIPLLILAEIVYVIGG